ncbi:DMT family transporter [Halanaerobium saccharolyticum]|nr:DMT family transporter [Halanaerobium saccharolyticum]
MFIWNLCAFMGTSIFALNFISMKILTKFLPTMLIVFLRFGLAGIFLFLFLIIKKKNVLVNNKPDLLKLFISALFGMSLYYYFFTSSLQYISPALASLICSIIPILTLLFDCIINKTKAKKITVFLFLLSIFGVCLVIDVKGVINIFATAKGFLLMLLGVISWIIYTIKVEYLLEKYNGILVLAYQCIFGSLITAVFAFKDMSDLIVVLNSNDFILIISNIIFVSLIATALGYLLYNLSIKNLGVALPSLYMNTMPIITLVASYFLLNSTITYKKTIGIMIVIISAMIVTVKENSSLNFTK